MDHLHILWTNAYVTPSKLMVMMYAKNALKNGWWDKVTIIVWGATVELLATNQEIQEEMQVLREYGVEFVGCITCATELGLVDEMTALGVDLYPWGPPLTKLIKENAPLLTV